MNRLGVKPQDTRLVRTVETAPPY